MVMLLDIMEDNVVLHKLYNCAFCFNKTFSKINNSTMNYYKFIVVWFWTLIGLQKTASISPQISYNSIRTNCYKETWASPVVYRINVNEEQELKLISYIQLVCGGEPESECVLAF